jgi:uncharacterized protein YbaA (DUF1428 family)
MMNYVDGFVIPVPKKNVKKYATIAQKAGKLWMEHGAIDYFECVADDVKPGKVTSFPQSVKLKKDEVVFVMADPRLAKICTPETMPFDGKRMFWGGFTPLVTTQMVKGKKAAAKKKAAPKKKAVKKAPVRKTAAKKKARR